MLFFSTVIYAFEAWAYNPYQSKKSSYFLEKSVFNISLQGLPKVENQRNLGFCYAFSARTLLEHYHCKENRSNCMELAEDQKFSVLDIASYDYNIPVRLSSGGSVNSILGNILRSKKLMAVESCAPYKVLDYKFTTQWLDGVKTTNSNNLTGVLGGWEFLAHYFRTYRESNRPEKELAMEYLVQSLNLEQAPENLVEVLSTDYDLDDFHFHSLVPKHCREDSSAREVLDYSKGKFPKNFKTKYTSEQVLEQMYLLLVNNIPFNINFCSSKTKNKQSGKMECTYHGSVIKGLKKVCTHAGKCEFLIQFHNSYGRSWQDSHDQGWVRLRPIINNMRKTLAINWVKSPSLVLNPLNAKELSWLSSRKRLEKPERAEEASTTYFRCGSSYVKKRLNDRCVPTKIKI